MTKINPKLENKVVVITGGSAGLGRAVAEAFAGNHMKVSILARGQSRLEAAAKKIEQLGSDALPIQCDVSDWKQVENAAQKTVEKFGAIDIWVNNAMTSIFAPFTKVSPEEFKRVTEVTYLGFVYGTMSALKRMLPLDNGIVIQVGSALAERSIPLQSAYCGAKHAIRGFTDSIRSELIHDNSKVRITMVQMPAMNTPQFSWVESKLAKKAQPVPPIYQPECCAEVIVWAATHNKREIYVGKPTFEAILGNKIMPGYLDRYLAKNGYDAQQTNEPENPGRPYNLWEPVEGDFGANGEFDERSKDKVLLKF
jgi:NADP-dependent 3-hydroxy acid dehydrogenase YdfG